MRPLFTVNIQNLSAVERVISPAGFQAASGPEIEKAVIAVAKEFRAKVRQEEPVGRGRLSQWQRQSHRGHGSLRKMTSLSSKRAGWNTVSRVKAPPIANILGSGAKPHEIRPLHGLYLRSGASSSSGPSSTRASRPTTSGPGPPRRSRGRSSRPW